MGVPRVLFVLKQRGNNNPYWHGNSSGLYTSVTFLVQMLKEMNFKAKMVEVVDNNSIDKEVTNFKPTHCVIEALWVVDSKFEILTKLHPEVKWIIRCHSDVPFLAMEGMAFTWLLKYPDYPNVTIAFNNIDTYNKMKFIINQKYHDVENIIYLPNYYVMQEKLNIDWDISAGNKLLPNKQPEFIDVACFGSIRPLKNHMMQAIASIKFANEMDKYCRFHVNMARTEGYSSESILKNLRALFDNLENHVLVEYEWVERNDFLALMECMDISLQVSMSETFNIVTADAVDRNIPVVVSSEINWIIEECYANCTSAKNIFNKMISVYQNKDVITKTNKKALIKFDMKTRAIWYEYLINGISLIL